MLSKYTEVVGRGRGWQRTTELGSEYRNRAVDNERRASVAVIQICWSRGFHDGGIKDKSQAEVINHVSQ